MSGILGHRGMMLRDPAGGDPFWSNVSLALHMNGANGSTSFADSGPSPKSVTPSGNAQISTAQSKFGGASLYLDGTEDYLQVASSTSLAFGTGDFTIEGWFRIADFSKQRTLFDFRPIDTNGSYIFLAVKTTGALMLYVSTADRIVSSASAVPSATWAHVACCRSSGTTRLFINGASVGTPWSDATNYLVSGSFSCRIGRTSFVSFSEEMLGYVDEIRIWKGKALYTSNFTPPSAPWPDF